MMESYPKCRGFKSLLRQINLIFISKINLLFCDFGEIGRHARLKICFYIESIGSNPISRRMASVTQLVRVLGCGSKRRGFKSPLPPRLDSIKVKCGGLQTRK